MHPKRGKINCKILKISPGLIFFKGPFWIEGLIFGGAYLWREICISKSIGLALQLEVNWLFLLYFSLYLRAISKYKPLGGIYLEGWFNGGFLALRVWGAYIWRGLFLEFYSSSTKLWNLTHLYGGGGTTLPPPPSIQTSPDYVKFHYFVGLYLP